MVAMSAIVHHCLNGVIIPEQKETIRLQMPFRIFLVERSEALETAIELGIIFIGVCMRKVCRTVDAILLEKLQFIAIM